MKEKEYFIFSNSNAAPFCSDTSEDYYKGKTPEEAFEHFVRDYDHPAGLFAAAVYKSADAMHKHKKPLYNWKSERAIKQQS